MDFSDLYQQHGLSAVCSWFTCAEGGVVLELSDV